LKTLTGISLILVILLVALSAYLRLSHSGIGCSDWPQCYGRIGLPAAPPAAHAGGTAAADAYQRIVAAAAQPLAWATPLHRLVASVLGLCVVMLNLLALRHRRYRIISLALLGLTAFLAVLGIRSGSLHQPAVIMGNLAGGFTLLGLLGWLWFRQVVPAPGSLAGSVITGLAGLATLVLAAQILLGGLTSANFAATACADLPACAGGWWPGAELATALDLTRSHAVSSTGQVIGGPERIAVHRAHRIGALLAALVILMSGVLAMRDRRTRATGLVVLLLLAAECSVGVASVMSGLPITLAVAHNWLAALLLLSLLQLLSLLPRGAAAGTGKH
jgi:cytochrome c oxidase assembly protein subunit 15